MQQHYYKNNLKKAHEHVFTLYVQQALPILPCKINVIY